MPTTYDYQTAAHALWGEAGDFIHECHKKHLPLFPGLPEQLPMVIGITAYGHCLGLTRHVDVGLESMRISIASNLFKEGTHVVSDTVLHEMLHCWLGATGRQSAHDSDDWYNACMALAPKVLGREINLTRKRRKSVRKPNPDWYPDSGLPKTIVRKVPVEGLEWTHADVVRFPHPFRPDDYPAGRVIEVSTY